MSFKKSIIFNLIQNAFVGIAITLTINCIMPGETTAVAFIISFFKAYIINFAACFIVPTDKLTNLICNSIIRSSNKLAFSIVRTLICTIFYVTIISSIMFIWEIGFNHAAFDAWKHVYIPLLIVGFIVGYIMGPISMKLAEAIVKEKHT